jgi:hypothetical protein
MGHGHFAHGLSSLQQQYKPVCKPILYLGYSYCIFQMPLPLWRTDGEEFRITHQVVPEFAWFSILICGGRKWISFQCWKYDRDPLAQIWVSYMLRHVNGYSSKEYVDCIGSDLSHCIWQTVRKNVHKCQVESFESKQVVFFTEFISQETRSKEQLQSLDIYSPSHEEVSFCMLNLCQSLWREMLVPCSPWWKMLAPWGSWLWWDLSTWFCHCR